MEGRAGKKDHRLVTEIGADYHMARGEVHLGSLDFGEYTHGSYPGGTGGNLNLRITDQVGTLRALWHQAGQKQEACSSLPYGDAFACTAPLGIAPTNYQFTGKRRDTESSNLDYFGARYYRSTHLAETGGRTMDSVA